ncbi:MAG: Fic family protein [Planctomycetaceae bacterium]|nr:Fic family protein [Planctomycetaceae bacterium]
MEQSHRWKLLEDLPVGWETWENQELSNLTKIWLKQHERLKDSEALRTFNDMLSRRWAIETGIIENIYTLDRGVTMMLVEHGFDASLIGHADTDIPPEKLIEIVSAHQDSLNGLFSFVNGEREFSTHYICELHQQLLSTQSYVRAKTPDGKIIERELTVGAYKKMPNNPFVLGKGLHEYCPPIQVQSEMERLVKLHLAHEEKGIPPEIASAWLHHRFTQIHPFEDGNGRVARAIASLVFIKKGLFPLLITRDDRHKYLDALGEADLGNLGPLVDLFGLIQRRSLLQALSISEDVLAGRRSIRGIIAAAGEQLFARRQEERNTQMRNLSAVIESLTELARQRLDDLAVEMKETLGKFEPNFFARADSCGPGGEKRHYFTRQIISIAKHYDYFANFKDAASWARLIITSPEKYRLIISFHGVGQRFSGAGVCIAFWEQESTDNDGDHDFVALDKPSMLMDEPFQFSCLSNIQEVRQPFLHWLENVVTLGLGMWQRQL